MCAAVSIARTKIAAEREPRPFSGTWFRVLLLAVAVAVAVAVVLGVSAPAWADESIDGGSDVELAKKSQNPLGDLISLPFENNFDVGFGPKDALIYTLNLKPVYPVHLGDDRRPGLVGATAGEAALPEMIRQYIL